MRRFTPWRRTPLRTAHTQFAVLLTSFFWGLSCLVPSMPGAQQALYEHLIIYRYVPIFTWGTIMLLAVAMAVAGEQVLVRTHRRGQKVGWWLSGTGHTVLFFVYGIFAIAALVGGIAKAPTWEAAMAAVSRPMLWGLLSYLHLTYSVLWEENPGDTPSGTDSIHL
jgi:hypothetical protein